MLEPSLAPSADAPLAETNVPARSATWVEWLSVVSVSLGAFASVTTEFLPVGILPTIADALKLTSGQAGLTITVPGVAAAIAAPAVTVGSGRLDRRRLMLILTALLVASNFITAVAPNFTVLLIGRLFLGVSLGGFWSIAASLAARLVPGPSAARALSVILGGISLGTILGVPAGVMIAKTFGWRANFWIVGGLATAVLLVQAVVLPALPSPRGVKPRDLLEIFDRPAVRAGFLAAAFMVTGQFATYTYIAPFLKERTHASPDLVFGLLLAYGIAGIVGNFLASLTVPTRLLGTFVGVVAVIAVSAGLLPLVGLTPVGASALIIAWGIAFGALPMCVQTWTFRAAPHAPEAATSVLVTIFQVCIATGSGLGGRVVDGLGVSAIMAIGAACTALAIPVLLSIRKAP